MDGSGDGFASPSTLFALHKWPILLMPSAKVGNHLAIKALMRNILIGALGLILFTDSDIE